MRGGPWHILHFVGHGGFDQVSDEGILAFEDEDGGLNRLPATQLARLLADHTTLRLVILNSCEGAQGGNTDVFSSTASILVRHGLPAVLAMQYPITDRAAIEFSRGFYDAVADGWPVDAAVTEARKSISFGVTNTLEWGTPVLFMRTPDGVLFRPETPMERTARRDAERQKREQTEREIEDAKDRLIAQRNATENVAKEMAEKAAAELDARKQAEQEEQHLADEKAEREQAEREAVRRKVLHGQLDKAAPKPETKWVPVKWILLGWVISFAACTGVLISFFYELHKWALFAIILVSGAIIGLVTSFALWHDHIISSKKSMFWITLSWVIGIAISWYLGVVIENNTMEVISDEFNRITGLASSFIVVRALFGGAIGGAVGGLGTAFTLRTEHVISERKSTLWITFGWATGNAIAFAILIIELLIIFIGMVFPNGILEARLGISRGNLTQAIAFAVLGAVGGGIGGAVGGMIMRAQVRKQGNSRLRF